MDEHTQSEPTAPRGTNLATLGFLMAATGPILLIVAGLAYGLDTGDIAFFVVPSLLGLAGAALVRRDSRVVKGVCIVLALGITMMVFWTALGLAYPDSFFDFVPGTLVLPGVLIAVAATVASMRAASAGRPSGSGERRAATVIVAALGLLAAGSAALTLTGRDTVPDALADQADLVVDMDDFEFTEDAYEVPAGGTILVKNSDPFLHNLTVEALDIDVDLGPASEALITVPDEVGTFVLYCAPHTSDTDDPGADDMASELTVG